jgi:hypothetical protein
LRGCAKSIRPSTQIRPAAAAIRPKTTIERPPRTGPGIVEMKAPNFGDRPRRMAIAAATMKIRVD